MKLSVLIIFLCVGILFSCSSTQDTIPTNNQLKTYKLLSLGDSYTIGESVCDTCRFPEQLKDSLKNRFTLNDIVSLDVIARTGWTTTNLIDAINLQNPDTNYDLVTVLIGVNNQYQGKPFSLYEEEFPQLITRAISFAKGDKSNVVVVSIPDYAYTPFGRGRSNAETISTEIDAYNSFAQSYCQQNDVTFVNITDITRNGLINPNLVASDGLHPSELAYTQFVKRLLPLSLEILQ